MLRLISYPHLMKKYITMIADRQQMRAYYLSHSAGDTTSALNLISDFNFDFAVMDCARFSKSS